MIVKTLPMVRLQLYTRPTLRVPVRDEELQVAAVVRLAPLALAALLRLRDTAELQPASRSRDTC